MRVNATPVFLGAILAAILLVSPAAAAGDHDHSHGTQCACLAKDEGWTINCTNMAPVKTAIKYLEANEKKCQVKDGGGDHKCKDNYFFMQMHHDHCTFDQQPSEMGHAIHDFEKYYTDCKIKRQYDSKYGACPKVDCKTINATLGDVSKKMTDNNCTNACGSTVCKDLFQKTLAAHDMCDEDLLHTSVEKTLHDYEEKCKAQTCNTATKAFELDTDHCPAKAAVKSSAGRATIGGAVLTFAAATVLAFA